MSPNEDRPGAENAEATKEQTKSYAHSVAQWVVEKFGWPVFPCHTIVRGHCTCQRGAECDSPGKHPRTKNGVKDATIDPESVRQWEERWPGGINWATACGPSAGGPDVVDVDNRHNGFESLRKWEGDHGELPRTLTALTGGGGRHLFFEANHAGLRNRIGWLPGVDFKTDGGYVMLVGSLHVSGGTYQWQGGTAAEVATMPAALVEALQTRMTSESGSVGCGHLPSTDSVLQGVPEGQRDNTLFRMSCKWRRQLGNNYDAVLTLALKAAQNCDPPFAEDQARKCVDSAFRQDHSLAEVALPDWARLAEQPTLTDEPDSPFLDVAALIKAGFPEPAAPTVLHRDDGVGLFYEGKVNWLFGDSETGKTWIALAAIVQVIRGGGSGWFVDLDHNTAAAIVRRLADLGLSAEDLGSPDRFRYAEPQDNQGLLTVLAEAKRGAPTLVVLDSMGEVLSMLGANPNSDEDVTGVHTHLLKPFSQAGACVIVIDHLSRGSESRAQGATGTIAKKRMVSGSSLRVSAVRRFAPGQGGTARLSVHKDRHGGLRARCAGPGQGEAEAALFEMGAAAGGWWLKAATGLPDLGGLNREHQEVVDLVVRVVGHGPGLNTSQIVQQVKNATQRGFRNGAINQALQTAEQAGRVKSEKVGRAICWYPVSNESSPSSGEDS